MEAPATPSPAHVHPGAHAAPVMAWIGAAITALFALLALVTPDSSGHVGSPSLIAVAAGAGLLAVVLVLAASRTSDMGRRADAGTLTNEWTLWQVVGGLAGGFVAANVIGGIIQVAGSGAAVGSQTAAVVAVGAALGEYAGMLGMLYLFGFAGRTLPFTAVGLRMPRRIGPLPGVVWILIAVPVAAITLVAAGWLEALMSMLLPHFTNPQCDAVRSSYGQFFVAAAITVSLVAPFAEEIVFRGFLYRYIRLRTGVPVGILLSATIFAAFHLAPLIFIPLLVVGAVLAALYEASDSLLPGMVVHALFNLVGVVGILSGGGSC